MARDQSQYTVQINADASRAKKEINDLLKSLKAVGDMNLDKLGLDTQIREASVAADELAIHLKNATNANTGKLNLVEFNKSIQASGRSMSQLITTLAQGGNVGQQAFRQLTAAIANTQVPIKQTNTLLNNMMTTLKNTVKWELSSAAVHSLESALSGAVSYVEDLNTSLTNIRIVTNKSTEDMAQFAIQANKAAKELSSTTKAYADASLIYFQQGDTEEMAAKKAAITLKAAHSSFNSTASEMSEYLTAVWNSYKVSGDELQRYVDIMAALGANTATSLEEIATSMQKVAATANTVGVSMEQVSSIIATVSSVTRESAESIGTSYKTIFARIGDLKLGKTDEDGIGLGTVSSQLQAIGVDILDQNQNLREMGDIITDLGNRWQTMTSAQKTATAQAVAGKRQYTQLMALFDNWDMYGKNLATAMNSEGTLEQMNSMYEEGLKAAQDRARASIETLYSALLDDKILKQFANATATIADNIANVVEALGGLGGVATTVGGLLLQVFSKKVGSQIKEIGQGIVGFVSGNSTYKQQYLKTFEDTKNGLASQAASSEAIKQTQNMLSVKQELLKVEDSLTAKQAEYMQSAISSYGEQISKLNELEQEYLSIEKTIKNLSSVMQTFGNRITDANGNSFETLLQNNVNALSLEDKNSILKGYDFKSGSYITTSIQALTQSKNIQYVGENMDTYIQEIMLKGSTQLAENQINVLIEKINLLKEQVKGTPMANFFDGFSEANLKTQEGLKNLQTKVQETVNVAKADATNLTDIFANILKAMPEGSEKNVLTRTFANIIENADRSGEALTRFKQQLNLTDEQLRRLKEDMDKMDNSFNKIANGISKTISTITSAISAFNMLSSVTKNVSLDSKNLIQNIGSLAMGLGTLIPVIKNIYSLGTLINTKVLGGAALALGPTMAAISAVAIIGTSIAAGLGQANLEKQLEKIERINNSVKEATEELDKSSQSADEAIKNYEEAEKARQEKTIGQSEYLTILDSVLESLDAEHLKVYALTGDYDSLRIAIQKANEERLTGDVEKAENLVSTGYYNLVDSLDSYNGKKSDDVFGRNGINLQLKDQKAKNAMEFLGFTNYSRAFGFDRNNWSWEGTQNDLIQLQSGWNQIQIDEQYRSFRQTEDFAVLTEYMKQFDSIFSAMDTLARTAASRALSNINIQDLENSTNIYDEVIDIILNSFGTNIEKATPYQIEMAQSIAKKWIDNLDIGLQKGFYEGYNDEKTSQNAQEYAERFKTKYGRQLIKVANDTTVPTFLLTQEEDSSLSLNGINNEDYQKIEDYKKYIRAYNSTLSGDGDLQSLIDTLGIDENELQKTLGIQLEKGQSLSEYLSSAGTQAKDIILKNIQGYINSQLENININEETYDDSLEAIIGQQKREITNVLASEVQALDSMIQSFGEGKYTDIESSKLYQLFGILSNDKEGLYRDAFKQLEFDDNGYLIDSSKEKLLTSSLGQKIDKEMLDLMILLTEENLYDFTPLLDYVFSTWNERIQGATDYWQEYILTKKNEIEQTEDDFSKLKKLKTNISSWSDTDKQNFGTYANAYGVDIGDWKFKTEGQQYQDVYSVMKQSFDKQWNNIPEEGSIEYLSYLEALQELNQYANEMTKSSMSNIDSNYSYINDIFNNLLSLDLSKPLDETIVSAERFQEIMGMTIEDFNKNYGTASKKQLALLKAQQIQSKKYAEELKNAANTWLENVGGMDYLQKDANAMLFWMNLSQQVADAQAKAANSATQVNQAYSSINDEIVAGIAEQWERANKAAKKQQEIASILSSSVDSGIISNEEAAIVGITADEWARYSIEVRAAKAASATITANNATIEALNNEKTAITGAIEYLDKYKNAWNQYILNDGDFERALNSSFLAGDFGEGDEAIAKMKEFREAREQAIAKFGSTDANKVLTEMSIILGIDKTELESQIKQVAGSGKDAINSIFSTMSQELQEKAQDAVDAWQEAFDKIAAAREKLASGGSLLEDIAGDPEALIFYAQQLGMSIEEAYNKIVSGMIDESQLKMPEFDLENAKAIYGLDKGIGQSREQDAVALGYEESDIKTDAFQAKVIPYYQKILMATGKYTQDAALELATSIARGAESYNLITDGAQQVAAALPLAAEAAETFTQRSIDAVNIEKAAEIDQQKYDNQIELQAALEEARDIKKENGDWKDISSENRSILEANGITGLNQVDAAAIECASALAQLAQAAYEAAKKEAENAGYTQNEDGAWGIQHTLTEQQGRLDYGSDWDQYKTTLTQNEDGTYNQGFEVVKEINDPLQEAEDRIKSLKGELEDLPSDLWDEKMSGFGLDSDEVDELGDSIQEMAESSDELADSLKDDAEAADEVAKELKRFDKAVESVKSNYKDWQKALKSDSLQKQNKAIKEMDKAFSDMLDIDYKSLSKDFITNAKNLELMKKAAEGSTKAYDELRDRAEDDLIIQAGKIEIDDTQAWDTINALQEKIHNGIDDIQVGAYIDNTQAIQAMNELINAAGMTAEQATNYLASMGIDAEVEQITVPEEQTYSGATAHVDSIPFSWNLPLLGSGNGSVPSISYETYDIPADTTKTATALRVKSAKKSSGGGFKINNSSGGGKGSGGGGGSKKKETKKHKRYQDEIERYHKNNETLSRVSEQLEKIEKQKERVYGAKYIDRIDEETEALKRQLEAQQALYDEANKYIAADKVAVARYGATFDQDGTIVNYEEVMRNIIDEYNRAIDVYNASDQEEGAKKALEAAEERYNDAVKSIENYEEAIQKANEAENNMLETRNKLSAAEVEKITYKLEFKLEMNERDLALLEYYQDKYAEQLDKQDDLFASYFDAAAEYEQNLNAIGEAYNSLVSKYAAGLITEKDYAEQLEELHDKALDNLKSLNEVEENLIDSYTQALELAQEQVEKTTSSIESANETLQSYMDILNLYEGATDYKKMANFYDMMNKNNITNIEVQKRHLDVLLAEEDKFQEKIRNGQELTELEKKEYEALEEQIQDTRETLLSTTQEALETIRSTYENTINGIADDLDNFMAGSAGSLSYLQEQYEQFQEEQEQYVSTTKELYEVSKLNRDIEGSIADATSKASKEALKALQEKINKQSELNQLTEYDLQMNELEYQLLLARINLEETKNAKDVVRLTRDDNGNYAYRYTANQDKIDEAAQKYEDVLQQINELTVERISDTEQKLVNAMANYKEKFVEIATDYTLTEEERLMKLEELTNNFSKNMQYIQEQNQIATDNLAANQEMIADYYGASMSEITSSTAGNVNDNIQSMMNKTQEYIEYMNNAIYGKEGWQTAWKEYIAGLGNIKESSGQAYEDMMNNAQEMGEMNDFSAEQAENVLNVLEDTLEPLTNLTEAWNAHNTILNNTIETYENLAQVIQGTLAAIGQIPNTVGAGDAKTTIDGKAYAKGGLVDYTGLAWVDGTPNDPELMLNAGDTQNILAAASVASSLDKGLLRTLMESVSTTAQAMLGMLSNAYHAIGINPVSSTTLDQQVHITAEFPNVTDHNEIEEALSTLVNRAAQFANHK